MFKRIRELNIASRRDVLLMAVATLLVFVVVTVWGVLLAGEGLFTSLAVSQFFLLFLFLGGAAAVGLLPFLTKWDQDAATRIPRLLVRVGIALQLFAIVSSVIGLWYATDPTRSVPVGFATFTAMLVGLFVAGFAGNALAPAKA